MTRRLRLPMTATLLLAGLLSLPRPLESCSCMEAPEPGVALAEASAVFLGIARVVHPPAMIRVADDAYRRGPVVVEFDVLSSWKGPDRDHIVVRTGAGGGDCGYRFHEGVSYLVYAYGKKDTIGTSICSRTRPGRSAQSDLTALGTASRDSRQGKRIEDFETAAYCPLHVDTPLEDGSGTNLDSTLFRPPGDYLEARRKLFPLSNQWILDAGTPLLGGARHVPYCPRCRAAEYSWMRERSGGVRGR